MKDVGWDLGVLDFVGKFVRFVDVGFRTSSWGFSAAATSKMHLQKAMVQTQTNFLFALVASDRGAGKLTYPGVRLWQSRAVVTPVF